VQEGCDKFVRSASCLTRAARRFPTVEKIVAEAQRLADAGVREITLVGQNVNAYHGDDEGGRAATLARLLVRLADVPGIVRLRYTTSHPCDMDESLIAAHRDLPALMPQLHLPVQSGSDRMLEAMNAATPAPTIFASSSGCAPCGPMSPSRRTSSSDFRARAKRISTTPCGSSPRWICRGLLIQIFAAPRHARGRMEQLPEAIKDERLQRLQREIEDRQTAFLARCRAGPSTCCLTGPPAVPARSPDARHTSRPYWSWRRHL